VYRFTSRNTEIGAYIDINAIPLLPPKTQGVAELVTFTSIVVFVSSVYDTMPETNLSGVKVDFEFFRKTKRRNTVSSSPECQK